MERPGWREILHFLALAYTLLPVYGKDLGSRCKSGDFNLHDFEFQDLEGSDINLSSLEGKAVLVVNLASFCSYTPQYLQLNELRGEFDGRFEILGVSCHQFGLKEPPKNEELLNVLKYVRPGNGFVPNFLITAKDEVNGDNEHPMYTFLKSRCPPVKDIIGDPDYFYWKPIKNGDITWNFNKFLIRPNGQPYKRYDSSVTPFEIKDDLDILIDDVIKGNDTPMTNQYKQVKRNKKSKKGKGKKKRKDFSKFD